MYKFTRISSDLLPDLIYIMNSSSTLVRDISQFNVKFATEDHGASFVGFIAHHKVTCEPAGYYGVFPVRVKLDGQHILAAQSGDTVTHPNHRGKGLFIQLAQMTYELAKECGISFVFGYPNSSSYPGFVEKLGWEHPFNMTAWNYYIPTLPLKFIAKNVPKIKKIHECLFRSLAKKFFYIQDPSNLTEMENFDSCFSVIHDQIFLKNKQNKGLLLRHKDVILWINFDGNIYIGNILDQSKGKHIKNALRKLFILSVLTGVVQIKSYFSSNSKLAYLLSNYGFTHKSLAYGFIKFDRNIYPDKLETIYLDYDTF